ncbi:MAG: S16 family serine protease, partial [Actinomycetes bacterium]
GESAPRAVITALGADSPSIKKLHVADIITAIDATPTKNSCQVIRALHDLAPGVSVAVTFRPAVIHDDGSITHTAPVVRRVTLAPPRGEVSSSVCRGIDGPNRGYLGVALDPDIAYRFPMKISISTPNIGGPSAGLAMTLGIIDRLSHGSLIRHKVVAATGTMSPDGTIGDVGGVPQKAVAISRENATLFLVPPGEFAPATSKASSSVHVVETPTLDSALRVLLNQGGSLRMADGTTESRSHQRSTP